MAIGEDYFDIYNIFVNEIIGDVWIAIILTLIILDIIAIKSKMPFELIAIFNVLMLAAFFSQTFLMIIWVFIVLFAGTIFYYNLSKAIGGN